MKSNTIFFGTFCALFAFIFGLSIECQAQNPSLCREVVASAGKSAKRQNISYNYTIGEAVVATFKTTNTTLTQGYQQPDDCSAVVLSSSIDNPFSVLVYPNPTMDALHFQFEGAERLDLVHICVVDAAGKVLSTQERTTSDFSEIDCSGLQAGTYILFFQTKTGQPIGSHTFIKI